MGFSKNDAYSPEEPPPERQLPDLLVNQTRPREEAAGLPPTLPPPTAPASAAPPKRYVRRPSAWPSVVLLLGTALIVGSLLASWWTFTIQEPNGQATITYNFFLGSQYSATCTAGTKCSSVATGMLSYSGHGLGPIGNLYAGAGATEIAGLVFAVLASLMALAGALGYWAGRKPMLLGTVFGVIALLLVLAAVLSLVALQTSAFLQSGGGIVASTAPSPATSFWGACSGGGGPDGACTTGPGGGSITASWGAGTGWYLALMGAVLLGFGVWLHSHMRLVRGVPAVR
jgi:hypothetical protein